MADITAQILTEIRDEAREARVETRENFKTVFHLLTLVETKLELVEKRLGLVETGMNVLIQRITSL